MKDLLKIYNYAKWQYKTSYSIPSVDRYWSANVPLDVPLRNQNNCQSGRTPHFKKTLASLSHAGYSRIEQITCEYMRT